MLGLCRHEEGREVIGFVTKQQGATFICLGLGPGCIAYWPLRDMTFYTSLQSLGDDWDLRALGGQPHSHLLVLSP